MLGARVMVLRKKCFNLQKYGFIKSVKDDEVTVKLSNFKQSDRFILSKNLGAETSVDFDDGRTITVSQRKKAYAMLKDISDYTGYSLEESKQLTKMQYLIGQRFPKAFSLSNCDIQTAKGYIDFLINFCIENEIPFRTQVFDEIQQNYELRVQLLMHRFCYICGKPHAEIDHVKPIGSGRNRRKIYQVGMPVWSLCPIHHHIKHTMPVKDFAQLFQIKPVKLTKFLIDYLGLANKGAQEDEK